jgi:hypothetical protein
VNRWIRAMSLVQTEGLTRRFYNAALWKNLIKKESPQGHLSWPITPEVCLERQEQCINVFLKMQEIPKTLDL